MSIGRTTPPVERDWVAEFESTYTGSPSAVEERVWREVLGAEYPMGLDPRSWTTVSELERFRQALCLTRGARFVDVGCGRGGAGLWIAAATGASLIGLDIAETALRAARERARAMRIRAEFRVGAFEDTGLEDQVADAVMSVDSLLFTPNKAAALHELRRILRPAGRLVMTSWDYHRQPVGRPPQVDDHRPLLSAAGFKVQTYEETESWRERQQQTAEGLLAASEELAAETTRDVAEIRAELQEMIATFDTMSRRFFLIATAV
jgi:SAM-dependent methyltransferase